MTTIIKLGGSVITEKDRRETLDGPALDRAADAIAAAHPDGTPSEPVPEAADATIDRLVVVHGGGSFGHPNAADHGVSRTDGTDDADAAMAIHGAMTTLDRFVLSRLHERGVPALPVHPLSAAARDGDGELSFSADAVETMLAEGFVPVTHGDVLAHAGSGATIVSGDELVASLAGTLDADRVGLCSTVPGVLDERDEVIDRIEAYEDAASALGDSDSTDVTGGMAAKVRALLALAAPASIFGPDDLPAFLADEWPGTTIDGTGSSD